jgi:Holliday junction resolvase RusA-like endonuclease
MSQPVVTVEVRGVVPITRNEYGKNRPSYRGWVEALRSAAEKAAADTSELPGPPFSLKVTMRTYSAWDQGSDLDNYVKDIQDSLASAGLFGEGNAMNGDEHIDRLEVCRERVADAGLAGMTAVITTFR